MSFRVGETDGGNIIAGIDSFIHQDNTQLAYASDMNISEDYLLEGVQSLGYYGFRELMSLGYDLNFTLGTFLLRGADIAGNLSLPGWQHNGTNNINSPTTGLYTFTGFDVHDITTILFTILGAKYGGGDLSVAQGSLITRQTRWRARYMLPGLAVS